MRLLEVRRLSYRVKDREILKNISFSLEEKGLTGIVGPNGCGKSTLLAHLSRRLPSENSVFYQNTAVEKIPRSDYAKEVAVMVQQNGGLSGDLLALQVALMGRYPFKSRFAGYTKDDYAITERALAEVGADYLAHKRIGTMSGGELQRVLIAKAFAQQPKLLLLDEPTNHLDVKHKLTLMKQLARYKDNAAVLIILHDISLAARFCDTVIVMKSGEFFAHGAAADILTPATLEKVFEVPFYRSEQEGRTYLYY